MAALSVQCQMTMILLAFLLVWALARGFDRPLVRCVKNETVGHGRAH
jgi:hypothetical protein